VYSVAVNSTGQVFSGTVGGSINRSTDNGTRWTEVIKDLHSVYAFAIKPTGEMFAGAYGGGVYLSTNGGTNWTAVDSGLTNLVVACLAINTTGQVFAGTTGGVFRSSNNGGLWTPASAGLTNLRVNAVAVSAGGPVYAGTFGGVFRSNDNGTSWSAANSGLTNLNVNALVVNSAGQIFAGTYGGVFRSTDGGGTWSALNSGMTSTTIVSALAIGSTVQMYAGTFAGGVFRSGPATFVETMSSDVPQSFVLLQNYPNPFNPTTNFEFRIDIVGSVTLKIFDVLGRQVAVLVNEEMTPGKQVVRWDGSGFPSGVYFYRLQAGGVVETRKMMLAK
jgi:photosystem II stability/assembly factor-like uncharacterized protein